MSTFWLGFVTASQLGLTLATGYVLYRYCYQPWKVLRADMLRLDLKVQEGLAELRASVTRAQVLTKSDEEVAFLERQQMRRSSARAGRVVGERETR